MSGTSLTGSSGYYGKVPILGDFVKYNLPRSFIEPWDDWLQEAILQSSSQLGDKWLDCYLTSPIYYFALTPGICGEVGWLGVVMPSVDRVGRYFPLTLCKPLAPCTNPLLSMSEHEAWLSRAELLALSSLQNGFTIDLFNHQIHELEALFSGAAETDETASNINESPGQSLIIRQALDSLSTLPDIGLSLLHSLLSETCFAYSLWWTSGSEVISPSLLLAQGLPPAASVAALFDGDWRRWGWRDSGPAIKLAPGKDPAK